MSSKRKRMRAEESKHAGGGHGNDGAVDAADFNPHAGQCCDAVLASYGFAHLQSPTGRSWFDFKPSDMVRDDDDEEYDAMVATFQHASSCLTQLPVCCQSAAIGGMHGTTYEGCADRFTTEHGVAYAPDCIRRPANMTVDERRGLLSMWMLKNGPSPKHTGDLARALISFVDKFGPVQVIGFLDACELALDPGFIYRVHGYAKDPRYK